MSIGVIVQDNVINGDTYRHLALSKDYEDVQIGPDTFKGFAAAAPWNAFIEWLSNQGLQPTFSCFRKSPAGQREPHYIHHDAMMGDWTAILYLNPEPHHGDGTVFWKHRSGALGTNHPDSDWSHTMGDTSLFTERFRVKAQFNRAVIFPSKWFHSRALFENYGTGDDARLIQVAFGRTV